ncbi:Sieve element occlusion [Macleaya cordata]|uniref:Sieve element occlusion n=1 Tax=Macleaya cordata TaxID=56857 RepID=A0A200RCY5_MACCD|nr:Sieve element occlusion [Macleaya cordata]
MPAGLAVGVVLTWAYPTYSPSHLLKLNNARMPALCVVFSSHTPIVRPLLGVAMGTKISGTKPVPEPFFAVPGPHCGSDKFWIHPTGTCGYMHILAVPNPEPPIEVPETEPEGNGTVPLTPLAIISSLFESRSGVSSFPNLKAMLWVEEEDDILFIKKILLTHDHDGRRVNTEALLQMMENVMCYTTTSSSTVSQTLAEALLCSDDVVCSHDEALWKTIHKVSFEILYKGSGDVDLHARTMALFDLLGNFTWDAKLVVALAAFATSYGEFCLLIQLYPINPLAVSIAMLKQLPNNFDTFKPRFKALSSLVKAMVDVTKCIIEFEGLLLMQHIKLDDKEMSTTKNLDSTTIATWELTSLVYKVNGMCRKLRTQVDKCHLQIEDKLHRKLLDLSEHETHIDNQEVLSTLFSMKDDKPLKDCSSQAKIGVSELVNKVVVLLISKPEILPLEELLFLVNQTCSSLPHNEKSERNYEFVWVPISSSSTWTDEEKNAFDYLSNTLPWYSVHHPWLLRSAAINYLKQESNFVDEPIMVVVDHNGRVTSSNAINMVYIWGVRAYPFSVSREEELWEEVNWSVQLIIDEIDPLLSKQVEEGRTLCLYGSNNIEWIREFTNMMKEMRNTGLQLDLVYVGKRRPSDDQHVSNITIAEEKLSGYLSYPKMHFFWLRLESIRRSKLKLGKKSTTNADHILQNVVSLMNFDDVERSWALFGEGSSTDTVQLQGRKLMECLKLFQVWGENIEKVGFMGAIIRSALEPPVFVDPCYSCSIVRYVEGKTDERIVFCEECKRPMEKLIVYQCNATE